MFIVCTNDLSTHLDKKVFQAQGNQIHFCDLCNKTILEMDSHYSVFHKSIASSKELCSKMALGEVGVSLP